ncbi:MAG: penicillin-binding protein 1B [Desulfocapsaceae bacterium]|nr:penicillin-binding protein 1B [Desulfocapsaceae bacterium]
MQITEISEEIRTKFDGKRWALPAQVYARPLEIYSGLYLSPDKFVKELELSGYRVETDVKTPGGYSRTGNSFRLITRPFTFPGGEEPAKAIQIQFVDNQIGSISSTISSENLPFVRFDPARIGSFHPLIHEDRVILQQDQIPEMLKLALMAVEDKKFYSHHGISISGIARAFIVNIKAGKTVQGGSTLTQQLVKNFFLNRERTLSRKFREVIMALLLEYHYSKEEILTAYINEVFLGQDGRRAIHGFALASQYYFRRDLEDLSIAQIATLVGMVKGPSYYNPLRNPENCLARRNNVLAIMFADDIIDEATYNRATSQPITDVAPLKSGFNRFPAFLELVKRQLTKEYREEDLKTGGLKILTTLDPHVQLIAEEQLSRTVEALTGNESRAEVEGAVIVTGRENGEVQALVGSKNIRVHGFNRALDAHRPIGSLIKPAVYLAGLANGYTLTTPLNDVGISLENDGKNWQPKNYDNVEHGRVAFYRALAKSYNLATVRLGMQIGLEDVVETLNSLGASYTGRIYPSLLLGSLNMSPLEVTQLYQTIASGGFYLPLRSIQSVFDNKGKLLTRYGLKVEQRFPAEQMYLLNHVLQRVMTEGTGDKFVNPQQVTLAGKTGTTNDLRDSWFAGYSGDRLAVVWLGNDDNESIALSGSSGALHVWGRVMNTMHVQPLRVPEPEQIVWRRIDVDTLRPTHIFNRNSTVLPFIEGSLSGNRPDGSSLDRGLEGLENTAREVLDSIDDLMR